MIHNEKKTIPLNSHFSQELLFSILFHVCCVFIEQSQPLLEGSQEVLILSCSTNIAMIMTRPCLTPFSIQNEGYHFSNASMTFADINVIGKVIHRERHTKWENARATYLLK